MNKNYSNLLGIQPTVRDALDYIANLVSLPVIRGKWFYVDPTSGSATSDGETPETAVDGLVTAYGLCTSGSGDGIILLSAGTTASGTTSYLTHPLLWTKHGITVVGAAAPVSMFGRARVATKDVTTGAITTLSFTNSGTADYISDSAGGFITAGFAVGDKITVDSTSNTNDGNYTITALTASVMTLDTGDSITTETAVAAGATTITNYCPDAIVVSGNNNAFYNVHISNSDTSALSLGGLQVSGHRNAFVNCHVVGGGGCAAAAGIYSVKIAAGQENTFYACSIGSDSVDRGNNACQDIYLSGAVARNRFIDCETAGHCSAGTAKYAVYYNATTGGRPTMFIGCRFYNWNTAGGNTRQAVAFAGTGANDMIFVKNSSLYGYAAWGGSAVVYIDSPAVTASAGGGIATTS
jgi:hypothetical protein